ncbi:MAG TPA: hypothetical protein VLV85_00505 [Stellaceae bacterium]|nr:hypothetical protein [Stellaceae bacterium]
MRAKRLVGVAMLLGGLSVAGCAPALDGSGESGGTIHQFQLYPSSNLDHAVAMAAQYCGQFGRSGHVAREELGWFWSDTITFDCVN